MSPNVMLLISSLSNKDTQTLLSYYQSAAMGAYIETFDEDCKAELNEYGKSLDLLNLE